jgi:two-component sensor histidine kinase
VPAGKIAVQWKIEPAESGARFRMSWRERGGPPVTAPEQNGFGRVLIEPVTAEKLQATALLTFEQDGVIWTIDAAAADVLVKASPVGETLT